MLYPGEAEAIFNTSKTHARAFDGPQKGYEYEGLNRT